MSAETIRLIRDGEKGEGGMEVGEREMVVETNVELLVVIETLLLEGKL